MRGVTHTDSNSYAHAHANTYANTYSDSDADTNPNADTDPHADAAAAVRDHAGGDTNSRHGDVDRPLRREVMAKKTQRSRRRPDSHSSTRARGAQVSTPQEER